jgi:hypothetical protein
VNADLRSPHSSAAIRLQAWIAGYQGFRSYLVFHGAGV